MGSFSSSSRFNFLGTEVRVYNTGRLDTSSPSQPRMAVGTGHLIFWGAVRPSHSSPAAGPTEWLRCSPCWNRILSQMPCKVCRSSYKLPSRLRRSDPCWSTFFRLFAKFHLSWFQKCTYGKWSFIQRDAYLYSDLYMTSCETIVHGKEKFFSHAVNLVCEACT